MHRFVVFFASLAAIFFVSTYVSAQSGVPYTVDIVASVPGCGDGVVQVGEQCDGSAFGGATCASQNFTSGTLACTSLCVFDTAACVYKPPSSGGGGGVSTRGAQVVLSGRAYPRSEITILKDAQVVATTISDENAHFQVAVKDLAAGTYIFSIYSEDTKGVRSSLFTFPVTVSRGILAKIDSIFIAPTITGDKIEVKKGEPITLFGQSYPSSEVTIEVNSIEPHFVKTHVGNDGVYLRVFDSSVLELGQHHAKARSTADLEISSQSAVYEFTVGNKNVYAEESIACSKIADFNADCRVNLIDFSIAAFWYFRALSPAFAEREKVHLNGDGKINLVDFSIMAFYWTG